MSGTKFSTGWHVDILLFFFFDSKNFVWVQDVGTVIYRKYIKDQRQEGK